MATKFGEIITSNNIIWNYSICIDSAVHSKRGIRVRSMLAFYASRLRLSAISQPQILRVCERQVPSAKISRDLQKKSSSICSVFFLSDLSRLFSGTKVNLLSTTVSLPTSELLDMHVICKH